MSDNKKSLKILSPLQRKSQAFFKKNGQEMLAFFSGRLGQILNPATPQEVPVFVFHSVAPEPFEAQLQFLADNGYTTIDADTLFDVYAGRTEAAPRTVALTFDDAGGSFWATAFPLLKKYGLKAILFVISGLVPEDEKRYPSLEEVWTSDCDLELVRNRERQQPLCTWLELEQVHRSGLVDIQSHSLTHSRIHTGPILADFLNPAFNPDYYENVNIPLASDDSRIRPRRRFRPGAPVYRSASIFSGLPRYLENTEITETLVAHVAGRGEEVFFSEPSWREQLTSEFVSLHSSIDVDHEHESPDETEAALRYELGESRKILEERLPGRPVRHFCYPWYEGSAFADQLAASAGYKSVYYGFGADTGGELQEGADGLPFRFSRIQAEYVQCLPGEGRLPLRKIVTQKLAHFAQRR